MPRRIDVYRSIRDSSRSQVFDCNDSILRFIFQAFVATRRYIRLYLELYFQRFRKTAVIRPRRRRDRFESRKTGRRTNLEYSKRDVHTSTYRSVSPIRISGIRRFGALEISGVLLGCRRYKIENLPFKREAEMRVSRLGMRTWYIRRRYRLECASRAQPLLS